MYKRKCKICSKIFLTKYSRGAYCDEKHYMTCEICDKTYEIDKYKKRTCSKKCTGILQEKQRKKSNLEKYGVENTYQREDIKQKIKETNLEKYGYEYTLSAPFMREKIKQTNLEKYGAENVFASDYGKEKIKETMLERYGFENPSLVPKIQKKRKEIFINKYGKNIDNPFKSPEVQEKIKETNLEKYGAENIFATDYGKEKIKETNLEKYGTEYYSQKHITNISDWNNLDTFITKNKLKYNCIDLSNYFSISVESVRGKIIEQNLERYVIDFYTFSLPEINFINSIKQKILILNIIHFVEI